MPFNMSVIQVHEMNLNIEKFDLFCTISLQSMKERLSKQEGVLDRAI